MISEVNKDQITSMWSVNVENKLIGKHFIILLTNGSHHCSCLSLINRGIICRHYFQIMLHSPEAKFHVRLIPSRWYNKNKDPSREPFLVASKFETEITPKTVQYDIPFLNAIHQITPRDSITQHELLTDIQLYGKVSGLARKVTIKAVKERDLNIINILQDYLKNKEEQDENESADEDNNLEEDDDLEENNSEEVDKENNHPIINNPNKKTKPKGRPKGTKGIRAYYEKKAVSESGNKQYRCSHCGGIGHNKRNCKKSM